MYAEYSAYYAAPVSTGKYAWAPFPTYTNSGLPTSQPQPVVVEPIPSPRRSSRSSSRRNSDPSPVYHLPVTQIAAEPIPLRRSTTKHNDKRVHFVEDTVSPPPRRSQTERRHRHSTPASTSPGEGRTFADYYQHYNERERSHHGSRRKRSSRERSRSDPAPASVPVVVPAPPAPPQLHRTHRYGQSHGYPLPPQTHPLQVEVQMNQIPTVTATPSRRSSRHVQTAVQNQSTQQQHPLYKYVSFAGGSAPPAPTVTAPSVVVQPEPTPLRRSSRRRSNTASSNNQVHIAAPPPLAPQSSNITAHAHTKPQTAPAPVESIFYLGSPQTAPLFVNRTDTRFRKREREPDPEREARRAERRRERAERDAPTAGRDLGREARREERRREREREKERERAEREKQIPQGRGLRRMKAFFFGR